MKFILNSWKLQRFNRQVGYLDCMAAESNEKMMLNWFEKMTLKSLQMQQRDGIIGGISQLRTVEAAVCACFRRISKAEQASLSFDLDTHRIMVEYTDAAKEKRRFALASRVAADHITGFAKYLSKSTVPCHVPCTGSH